MILLLFALKVKFHVDILYQFSFFQGNGKHSVFKVSFCFEFFKDFVDLLIEIRLDFDLMT